ncbi:hypothetical protein AMTR_s00022p00188500 [Amborella trichopoda]|uniref:Uncharacterized protein n=2 Tax=Amborella trichopoda TaxID=13333 RepID=W1PUV1_AMBTC|nr:hypothetical protein AMTR_s00022p00188500 [Amborella trichopoda]
MTIALGKYNIKVNLVAPDIFKSAITSSLLEKDWLDKVVKKTYPLQTLGTTDPALTSLIVYLIGDDSNYVTGNAFVVDSGGALAGVPIYSSL